MHPELFEIPFIHLTVKSYGTMMVVGFLAALFVMCRMARLVKINPESISNASLYALISGLIGAKLFYFFHHHDQFANNMFSVFSGWGFEFLGGVIFSLIVLPLYLWKKKLPLLITLDIMAIGLMIGLGFGRIGCFFNGCCYGKITDSPLGIRFPYDSITYNSQVRPDTLRNRTEPQLVIGEDYFGWLSKDSKTWIPAGPEEKYQATLKPFKMLSDEQKQQVTTGPYRCMKVHPTQLYETGYALLLAGAMFLFWRFIGIRRPGLTMATVMWIYGILRFVNESLRDDNPFEYAWWMLYKGGTISQNIGLYLVVAGAIITLVQLGRGRQHTVVYSDNSKSRRPKKK